VPHSETVYAYVRSARRLRARLGHDPQRLHESLNQLNRWHGRGDRDSRHSVLSPQSSALTLHFEKCVASQLTGGVLRYSTRVALLHQAKRLGIGRFEANLIIASIQHRFGRQRPTPSPRRFHLPATLTTVIFAQTAIVLTLWWLLTL
jgi:hypothetical protein